MHKSDIIAKYRMHENDKGSTPVQIALLSQRIKDLTEHFQTNKKDKHSRRGLLNIIRQRQRLLKYYKRTHTDQYYQLIQELGIRDKKQA